jgi:glutamine phosphoribosylpyrophosphate amidotransferase
MSTPRKGRMIKNNTQRAFIQPDISLRKTSVKVEISSQIQAMNKKNNNIVQNRSISGIVPPL